MSCDNPIVRFGQKLDTSAWIDIDTPGSIPLMRNWNNGHSVEFLILEGQVLPAAPAPLTGNSFGSFNIIRIEDDIQSLQILTTIIQGSYTIDSAANNIQFDLKTKYSLVSRNTGGSIPTSSSQSETDLNGSNFFAISGAVGARIGRFEQANEGTIFLDEIADMSLRTQAKILRVLQEREFERVGGNRTIKSDVRIISATNKNLEDEIVKGNFREDLYYRLKVVQLKLPPLRDRSLDIVPFAYHFLARFASSMNKNIKYISAEARELLVSHSWPGNIRELKKFIERSVLFCEGDSLSGNDLGISTTQKNANDESILSTDMSIPDEGFDLEKREKELIIKALEKTGWVQKTAAHILGLTPRILNYRIKRFSITHNNWIVNS